MYNTIFKMFWIVDCFEAFFKNLDVCRRGKSNIKKMKIKKFFPRFLETKKKGPNSLDPHNFE